MSFFAHRASILQAAGSIHLSENLPPPSTFTLSFFSFSFLSAANYVSDLSLCHATVTSVAVQLILVRCVAAFCKHL